MRSVYFFKHFRIFLFFRLASRRSASRQSSRRRRQHRFFFFFFGLHAFFFFFFFFLGHGQGGQKNSGGGGQPQGTLSCGSSSSPNGMSAERHRLLDRSLVRASITCHWLSNRSPFIYIRPQPQQLALQAAVHYFSPHHPCAHIHIRTRVV